MARDEGRGEEARQGIIAVERNQKAIRQELDRLDEAFLDERSINIESYDRQGDRLRDELTLA